MTQAVAQIQGAPPPQPVPVDQMVENYIRLRDAKAEFGKKYDEKIAPIDAEMKRIEAELLRQFQQLGIDSAGSQSGTAYKSTRTSCSVKDWPATLGYIQQHGLWHMLERRVSKTAVEEFVTANGDLPPGLDMRTEVTINVRRS
jgi:hypothetical protein